MSDTTWIVLGALGAFLLWRLTECLRSVTGAGLRSREREQQQMLNLLERLSEKLACSPDKYFSLDQLHVQERAEAVHAQQGVEREAVSADHNGSTAAQTVMTTDVDQTSRSLFQ